MPETPASVFIKQVELELRPLCVAANLAQWEGATTGTDDALARGVETETTLRTYLSSESRYLRIEDFLNESGDLDKLTRRQLELLAIEHRPNQLAADVIDDLVRRSKKIEAEFRTFRATLDGREVTDNDIIALLRNEKDEGRRRAAWEASKQVAPRVADDLLELVTRRNEAARSLGFRDFYAMQLTLQEIDEGKLLALFDDLRERTEGPFLEAKAEVDARVARRFGIQSEELRPWHYDDPFFQEPPLSGEVGLGAYFKGRDLLAIAARFFEGVGLPVDDVLERSDLRERPGKDQHAYCTDIDREGDVRILCNIKDDDRWMGILLHELGHAAYSKFTPVSLPWILRQPAHIATTEAIALFMDRLLYDLDWLRDAAELELEDPLALKRRARQAHRFEMLLLARWVLVMTFFERELYANPDREHLDEHWWHLVEELQGLRRPEGRKAPDWAAKIHLAVAPVYYHNYQLGELMASQFEAALRTEAFDGLSPAGFVGRTELGDFLRERIFLPGASINWQALLRQATGYELSADAFMEEVCPDPAIQGGARSVQ